MDEVVLWALIAVGLLVTEVLTLTLVAGMLGVGALAALVLAAVGTGLPVQLLGFAGASALLLVAARPAAQRALGGRASLPNSPDAALVGERAVVVAEVGDDAGQVRVNGELWSARAAFPGDRMEAGRGVFIASVSGATVRVYPSDLDHPPAPPRA